MAKKYFAFTFYNQMLFHICPKAADEALYSPFLILAIGDMLFGKAEIR